MSEEIRRALKLSRKALRDVTDALLPPGPLRLLADALEGVRIRPPLWPQNPPANPPVKPGASPKRRVEVVEQVEELPGPPGGPPIPREPEVIRLLRERARAGTLMPIRSAIARLIASTARAVEARAALEAEEAARLAEERRRPRYALK